VDYARELVEQNELFGALVADADGGAPVPTCPGWNLTQLCRHIGRGDRWAAQIVADRMSTPLNPRDVQGGKPPEDGLVPWLRDSSRAVLDAVAEAGETPVWTFVGPKPATWWVRRRLHEWTVHRADAALALGLPYELSPELAADGLSEWLGLVAARSGGEAFPLENGQTLHLHATDEGLGSAGEWSIRPESGGVAWEHAHVKATTAVRGPAVDLFMVLTRRVPVADSGVQLFGDPAVLDTWLERTGF
jgi:uncharacterized protein (TIGR03083 family)